MSMRMTLVIIAVYALTTCFASAQQVVMVAPDNVATMAEASSIEVPVTSHVEQRHQLNGFDWVLINSTPDSSDPSSPVYGLREAVRQMLVAGIIHADGSKYRKGDAVRYWSLYQVWTAPYKARVPLYRPPAPPPLDQPDQVIPISLAVYRMKVPSVICEESPAACAPAGSCQPGAKSSLSAPRLPYVTEKTSELARVGAYHRDRPKLVEPKPPTPPTCGPPPSGGVDTPSTGEAGDTGNPGSTPPGGSEVGGPGVGPPPPPPHGDGGAIHPPTGGSPVTPAGPDGQPTGSGIIIPSPDPGAG